MMMLQSCVLRPQAPTPWKLLPPTHARAPSSSRQSCSSGGGRSVHGGGSDTDGADNHTVIAFIGAIVYIGAIVVSVLIVVTTQDILHKRPCFVDDTHERTRRQSGKRAGAGLCRGLDPPHCDGEDGPLCTQSGRKPETQTLPTAAAAAVAAAALAVALIAAAAIATTAAAAASLKRGRHCIIV